MKKKKVAKAKKKFGIDKIKLKPKLVKKRRKEDHCLNCNTQYDKESNYCPNCGQENNHNRASFGTLIVDFFHNYFSFDSKFSNSLLPFFIQPGYLTQKFIEGKRASFVNPVRLYLIISLVFFFVFSMVSKDLVKESVEKVGDVVENLDESIETLPDEEKQLVEDLKAGDFSKFNSDSVYQFTPAQKDSTKKNVTYSFQKPDSTNEFITDENIAIYMALRNDFNYEVKDIMDTLHTSSLTSFQFDLTQKLIRLDRAENQVVISQLLKNLPIMMMVLIPFFALILKLFYLRRKQFYITHLIHALYLHSFAYIIYGFAVLMAMYWFPEAGFWIVVGSILLVSTHSFVSFLKVYQQKKFKSFIKFNLIGFMYTLILFFALFIELFFSIITY